MAEHAKLDVAPMKQGEAELSTIEGGVQDDFGKVLFDDSQPDEPGEDDDAEERQAEDTAEDDQPEKEAEDEGEGEDDNKKHGPVPYNRFSEVNKKMAEFRDKNLVLENELKNVKEFIEKPEVQAAIAEKMQKTSSGGDHKPQDDPIGSLKDIDFDGKTDGEISIEIAKAAGQYSISQLKPILDQIVDSVGGIQQVQTKTQNDGFFKENKVTAEKRSEIETFAAKHQLPLKQAYYAIMGEDIKKNSFNDGATQKTKKAKKDVIGPSAKVPLSGGRKEKPSNVEEAFNVACKKLGIQSGDFDQLVSTE